MPEGEGAAAHHREIHQQRCRDPHHVPRVGGNGVTLQGEEHHDSEQQPVQSDRADLGEEPMFVPVLAFAFLPERAGEEPCGQGDAQEHQHAVDDGGDGEPCADLVQAEPAGQHLQVEPAQQAEGEDLEHRVDRHQHGPGFPVAAGQVVPDQDHRDAPGQPHDDQPGAVGGWADPVAATRPGRTSTPARPASSTPTTSPAVACRR